MKGAPDAHTTLYGFAGLGHRASQLVLYISYVRSSEIALHGEAELVALLALFLYNIRGTVKKFVDNVNNLQTI